MFRILKQIFLFLKNNIKEYERPQAFKEMDRRQEEITYSHLHDNIHHENYSRIHKIGGIDY